MNDGIEQGIVSEERCEPNRNSLVGGGRVHMHPPVDRFPNEAVITKIDNGFIVKIGCKTLAGRDWEEVSNGLDLYWIDPAAAERLYLKK